ncbi:MAG: DUF1294 domain-containing protein [Erysipelotrichaceae bacterium]|nr:DUF1294 domain-containing protein [Erysipelotrichaceae bacterium]
MNTNILIIYAVMNILTFITYGADKLKAFRNKYRISEKTLLIMSVFGIFGALAGMFLFRHKIRKPLFLGGLPFILFIELLVYWLVQQYLL